MAVPNEILADLQINEIFKKPLAESLKRVALLTYVDILVVVDVNIATQPGIGFGIGSVIELIRKTKVGCMRFRVDIAQRSGAAQNVVAVPQDEYRPKYEGFRFDMTHEGNDVIDQYEQIWCFGFAPDNDGGPDSNINKPSALPATDSELAKLAAWMRIRKGGLFATGDHDYLGASMCHRIPRIGTMRQWTNADGVPPIGTPERIDTLRPPSPAYEANAPGGPLPLTNRDHQGDLTIQPIEWVSWKRIRQNRFIQRTRPHPVLCHPTLGPINVMPDHAHEGRCNETSTINLNAIYSFDGEELQPEYPDAVNGGQKPVPMVIAYGRTLSDPPYNFGKREQPARRFPMISVYNGHPAGVGRCATDSTWHHWMDVNIREIQRADNNDWKKVSQYFINLAVWLNPPDYNTRCLYFDVLTTHFQEVGFQEYSARLNDIQLGEVLRESLLARFDPCWVSQVIIDIFDYLERPEVLGPPFEKLDIPGPDVCLSCPPLELIENAVLGGLVRASLEDAGRIKQAVRLDVMPPQLEPKSLDEMMLKGAQSGLETLLEMWHADMKRTDKLLQIMAK